jgi:hypothetical protein
MAFDRMGYFRMTAVASIAFPVKTVPRTTGGDRKQRSTPRAVWADWKSGQRGQ